MNDSINDPNNKLNSLLAELGDNPDFEGRSLDGRVTVRLTSACELVEIAGLDLDGRDRAAIIEAANTAIRSLQTQFLAQMVGEVGEG